MWRDRNRNQISGVAVALFAVSAATGLGLVRPSVVGRRSSRACWPAPTCCFLSR